VAAAHLDDFVVRARVARLATVDAQGRPSLVPICFAVHGGVLYSALDAKPKRRPVNELQRVRNIRENPQVAVLVDFYNEDWEKLRYALLHGAASLVAPGHPDHALAIGCLRAKYPQYARMPIEQAPVIQIEVHRVTCWPRPAIDEEGGSS